MSGIRSPNGGDVFAIWFEDVLTSARPAHDEAPIVQLNEHITRSGPLNIIYHLAYRPALLGAKPGMVASR
jgi:hypothetical protein